MVGSLSLREAWTGLGVTRKFFWVVGVFSLSALVAAWLWMSLAQREYRVLFAGLSDADGGHVVAALDKLRIPYQLNEPGGSIEVPLEQFHLARYRLAVEGLPKAEYEHGGADHGGDYPAAGQAAMRFGMSSFQEQAAHQHALEAELAHSIEMLDGIKSARVHLALPKQSAFLREPVLPSASVLITPEPAAALLPGQIEAVRLLVASSVPGMLAEQVNVLDQHGALPALQSSSPSPQTEIPADAMPNYPVKASPATIPKTPQLAQPVQPVPTWMEIDRLTQNREVLLGLLLAAFVAWLLLRLRARSQRAALQQEADAQMQAEQSLEEQSLDVRLVQLRQRVMADPRVAASVVKLWLQET